MKFQELVFINTPLQTERLIMEEINLSNFLSLRDGINSEPATLLSCRPTQILPLEDAIKHFENFKNKDDRFTFSIIGKANKTLIGRVSLFDYNPRNKAVELGYFIFKEFRNKGYGTEILECIQEFCFDKIEINKLIAQTGSFNKESIKLLEKSGFYREGILREHHEINGFLEDDYIYSILKKEYEGRK